MKHYDVVVVGAGVVGASAALGFAKQGREVLLVEAAEQLPGLSGYAFDASAPYDLRVFAISYASERLFRYLGVWGSVLEKRACAYTDMQVWDEGGSGQIHFGCEDIDRAHLGHIVESTVLVASLIEAVQGYSNITLACGEVVESITLPDAEAGGASSIALHGQGEVQCELLVAADGARSQVRSMAGINVSGDSYQQQGIVAVVDTQKEHLNTAWQRFISTGPIAFLPLSDGTCSIVWSADQQRAEELLAMDDKGFAEELMRSFDFRLGDVVAKSPRAAFPLNHSHADEYVRSGLVLVGDAAHVIHPLAGQGVNLGLLDVATLIEELDSPKPLGAIAPLRRYARRRRHANQMTLSAMTAMNSLFKSEQSALKRLRNQGMQLAGDNSLLRRQFALRAAGMEGDVPKLIA